MVKQMKALSRAVFCTLLAGGAITFFYNRIIPDSATQPQYIVYAENEEGGEGAPADSGEGESGEVTPAPEPATTAPEPATTAPGSGSNESQPATTEATTAPQGGEVTSETTKPEKTTESEKTTEDKKGEEKTTEASTVDPHQDANVTTTVDPNASAEMQALQAKLALTQNDKIALQKLINSMMGSQNNFIQNLAKFDDQILEYQKKLDNMAKQKAEAEVEIASLEVELAEAESTETEQYEQIKTNIQMFYENYHFTYLDALLSAKDYTDVVNKFEYIRAINEYESNILSKFTDKRQRLADKKAILDSKKADISMMEKIYVAEQDNLNLLAQSKEAQIKDYQAVIDEAKTDLKTYEEMENSQNAEIARIEAKYRAATTYQNVSFYGGGIFTWPAKGYNEVGDKYGPRTAPTAGATSYHRGWDIGMDMGAPIVAAAPGQVIYAGYFGSGGNCVIIDHGNGLSTCYMHCSGFNVKEGDVVKAGDVVSFAGETGVATGPHLHFAVRMNGEYIDPAPYLTGR